MTSDTQFSIRTYNNIAPEGLAELSVERYQVSTDVAEPDAILLRSHNLEDGEIPPSVRAIARAGSGVNNIPVEAMTERGIVVFNAPGANANAVSEIVIAALLAQARRLFLAVDFVSELQNMHEDTVEHRVEAEKNRFRGTELQGTTVGVVGLGAIGSRVARLALSFGMNVLGYDPAISVEGAWQLSGRVQRVHGLEELAANCDYMTLHMPVLDTTRGLVGVKLIEHMRPGAGLLNFARAAIVDGDAVLQALDSGHLSGYATDFPSTALLARARMHNDVQLFPHLGASTSNAETNCAIMASRQLRAFLEQGAIANSVNFPQLTGGLTDVTNIAIANRNIPRMLGLVTGVLADRGVNVLDLVNHSRGEIAYTLVSVDMDPGAEAIRALIEIDGVLSVRLLPPTN